VLVRPGGVAPVGVDRHGGERGEADLALDDGPDHERPDAHGELAELAARPLDGDGVVGRGDEPDAAAGHLSVHPGDDELRALLHRPDDEGEAEEEGLSRLAVVGLADGDELVERGAGAPRAAALAPEHHHAGGGVLACRPHVLGEAAEQGTGHRVALGVAEADGGDPVAQVGGDEPFGGERGGDDGSGHGTVVDGLAAWSGAAGHGGVAVRVRATGAAKLAGRPNQPVARSTRRLRCTT
jgi:hypothetical protein